MSETILKLSGLTKLYKKGLGIRRYYGLRDLSLEIYRGEILGVIGPNGAGKTTTFKLILGLIYPNKGTIEYAAALKDGHKDPKRKIGFLPENPYFYSYLTVEEALNFYAALFDYPSKVRKERVAELLELVGMTYARKRPLGKLSRGMLQRVGIAQAIVNDPEFLILDEPMSGLDPVGRKEIRDIIINFGKQGKTVIFSSHILSDVEMICDRVAMIMGGELKTVGLTDTVLDQGIKTWEVEYTGPPLNLNSIAASGAFQIDRKGDNFIIKFEDEALIAPIIDLIRESEGRLLSLNPKRSALENIYANTAKVSGHA